MDLLTLAAKLTLDSSSFTSGISDAEKQGSTLSQKLGKVASAAKKVAGALVFKKGIQAIKNLADETAKAGDAIDKNSQKLGLSRKGYQEWSYILSQCGTDISSMSTSMKTLNSKILSGSEAVGKLGLSFEDLSKMNMEQQFEAVVKAFQEMPESAEKSALAVELFGKNGMELLPLLNSSAESIDALKQKFHELGIEMSDDQIDAAVRYTDAMDTLTRVFDGIKYAIGAEVLPIMAEWAEKGAAYAGKLLAAFKGEDGGEGGLSAVFKVMSEDFQGLIDKLKENDSPVLQLLGKALQGVKDTADIIVGLFTNFDGTVAALQESDKPVLQALGDALEGVKSAIALISSLFTNFDQTVQQLQESDKPVLRLLGKALEGIKSAINLICSLFANFDQTVQQLQESDKPVLRVLGKALEAIKSAINLICSLFANFDQTVQQLQESDKPVLKTLGKALEVVKSAIVFIVSLFANFDQTVQQLQESDKPILRVLGKALEAIKSAIVLIVSLFTNFDQTVQKLEQSDSPVLHLLGAALHIVKTAIVTIVNLFTNFDKTVSKLQESDHPVLKILGYALSGLSKIITGVVEGVKTVIDSIKKLFGLDSSKTFDIYVNYHESGNPPGNQSPYGSSNAGDNTGHAGWGGMNTNVPMTKAKGDWNVPFDNFPALLHRGEMVLTANQARRFRAGEGGEGGGMDMVSLTSAIVAAVKQGMEGATVKSFLDGRNVTNEVMRIAGNNRLNARFT